MQCGTMRAPAPAAVGSGTEPSLLPAWGTGLRDLCLRRPCQVLSQEGKVLLGGLGCIPLAFNHHRAFPKLGSAVAPSQRAEQRTRGAIAPDPP